MKRILLDTSVYGELIKDPSLIERLKESKEFIFYGNKIIRDELRKISKDKTLGHRKLIILLLNLYDSLIKKEKHSLEITELINLLAAKYFSEYNKLGGGYSKKKIIPDFLIVACATLHKLDILVSHDTKSMLGDKALLAYQKVNKEFQLENHFSLSFKNSEDKFKHPYKLPH